MASDEGTIKLVTTHVALILWTTVVALAAIGFVCIFQPPQEWALLSTVVGALKELAFLIAGGWLALLHPSKVSETVIRHEPAPAPKEDHLAVGLG